MTTDELIRMLENELEIIKELAAIYNRLTELADKMEAVLKGPD